MLHTLCIIRVRSRSLARAWTASCIGEAKILIYLRQAGPEFSVDIYLNHTKRHLTQIGNTFENIKQATYNIASSQKLNVTNQVLDSVRSAYNHEINNILQLTQYIVTCSICGYFTERKDFLIYSVHNAICPHNITTRCTRTMNNSPLSSKHLI